MFTTPMTVRRNGIVSAIVKRVTFQNAFERKPAARQDSVSLQSFNAVVRTRGIKSARRRQDV